MYVNTYMYVYIYIYIYIYIYPITGEVDTLRNPLAADDPVRKSRDGQDYMMISNNINVILISNITYSTNKYYIK